MTERARSTSGSQGLGLAPASELPPLSRPTARNQSDLLFVYATDCQLYQRCRLFGAEEAKGYCVADSAVLDTRTGIVPFTSRARQDVNVVEQKTDMEFAETLRNAETAAVERAMLENAENLVSFLRRASSATR